MVRREGYTEASFRVDAPMRRLLLPALIALTLAGCGNKGALVLPNAVPPRHRVTAPTPVPAPASSVPAAARSTG